MKSRKKILFSLLVLLLLLAIFWLTTIKLCCCEADHKVTYEQEIINDSLIINSVPFKDTTPFITYWDLSNSQQIPYKTKKLTSAKVKLFTNYGNRKKQDLTKLIDVYGINQFFMDYDFTTGYVHPYTQNFFKKLTPEDFILVIKRDESIINECQISYKKVKNLGSRDSLGQNIGFFRQWKLSDIDMNNNKVNVKTNGIGSYYLQVKKNSSNQFKPFIPLWSKQPTQEGYIDLSKLNKLNNNNGGTAVILWENKANEVFFIDIHSSIKDIIECLVHVKNTYDVDPTLGIFDAAPMTRKFKADSNNCIDFKTVNIKTSKIWYVGAGFGYKINQY